MRKNAFLDGCGISWAFQRMLNVRFACFPCIAYPSKGYKGRNSSSGGQKGRFQPCNGRRTFIDFNVSEFGSSYAGRKKDS